LERIDIISVGDLVEVSGVVVENFGLTEISTVPKVSTCSPKITRFQL
jgi:predicted extracellular nuclease